MQFAAWIGFVILIYLAYSSVMYYMLPPLSTIGFIIIPYSSLIAHQQQRQQQQSWLESLDLVQANHRAFSQEPLSPISEACLAC